MVLPRVTDLYDRVASSYHGLWLPVIEPAGVRLLDLFGAVVAARPEALIVDVGAGTGTLGRAAVARWPGVRVISIDPSEAMLAVGRAAAASSLDGPALGRLDWMRGTAERLPVDSASADIVASSFMWQYLPARAPAYREARRVLQPGGVLAVMTWLLDDWSFLPWRQLSEVLEGLGIERQPFPRVAGPFRSLPSAAAAVRRAGFREVWAVEGLVDHQWTTDALVRCTVEEEELELFDRLDAGTCRAVERLWRERLAGLGESDLRYRGAVAYVTGRAPLPVAEARLPPVPSWRRSVHRPRAGGRRGHGRRCCHTTSDRRAEPCTMSTPTAMRGNLPAELTTFVGRHRQLQEIKSALATARLVTLVGTGGVGKTRLALRSAADLRRGIPDGVWLVELAGLEDAELVAKTVMISLGLRDESSQWPVSRLIEYVSSKRLLLVLDNCEHLLDACAVLADAVMREAPSVRILATGTQALGVNGETVLQVGPLSVPEPDGRAAPDRIVQRARSMQRPGM